LSDAPELRMILPLAFDEQIRKYCTDQLAEQLPHVVLSASFLLEAVSETVSDYDQVRNAPWILKSVQAAVRDGCDGIFLGVAFDTGLAAAKSIADVPVLGALESAVAYARILCRRFSILAINSEEVAVNYRLAREYGFMRHLSSVEPIDIPVRRLQEDRDLTMNRLEQAAARGIAQGAQAVILGCTGMGWTAPLLADRIPVPVLDTSVIGLHMLETLVALRLRQSAAEYQLPSGLVPLSDDEHRRISEITFLIHSERG